MGSSYAQASAAFAGRARSSCQAGATSRRWTSRPSSAPRARSSCPAPSRSRTAPCSWRPSRRARQRWRICWRRTTPSTCSRRCGSWASPSTSPRGRRAPPPTPSPASAGLSRFRGRRSSSWATRARRCAPWRRPCASVRGSTSWTESSGCGSGPSPTWSTASPSSAPKSRAATPGARRSTLRPARARAGWPRSAGRSRRSS
mmetsp:Transcript_48603/g.110310  ORF Transcript_48603/g.110310 Transcript_48603/m.110310 type:complete len:201 (+) Transcript_48603:119-721(+)